MKKQNFTKMLSALLAFILVLSLATPFAASANTDLPSGTQTSETAHNTNAFKDKLSDESTLQQKAAIAEQLNLIGGEATLHEQLQKLSGNEQIPVIIHFSERSVALEKGIKKLNGKPFSATEEKQTKQKVKNQQIRAKKEMVTKGIKFNEGYTYDTVLNGMSGTIKADDLEKLLEVSGVTLIEPDTTVTAFETSKPAKTNLKKPTPSDNKLQEKAPNKQATPAMDTSIGFLGIEALWAEGYEGQGIKVAVLDTGIDADHPEFQGIYKGGKNFVPHTGTDYARPRAADDASETSPLDRPDHRPEFNERGSSFYTSHGTHVAGTIAAIGNNEYGIKGIAPKIDLYAYRVLGAYGSGSTSGIIKAIDTAVIEGMDVINLSLGGGANSETDGASFAINNAMLAGTISVIATGNSGPNRGTMGTPATSRLGIAVGNTTNPEARYFGDAAITIGDYNLSKTLNLMGTTFGQDLATQLNGEYSLIAVPGVGKSSDYAGLDVNGKVALVSRGEIAFVDKIAAAKDNGAVAVIVHNFAGGSNAPGPSGTFLGDAFEFIPTFDMSQTDGDAIRAALTQAEGTITFSNFDNTLTTGDDVNNSSSRGPSTPNFDIKPDVTAPGTNIMSAIPMYKADFPEATYEHAYTRKTGTSMATPHIAGIAALVKQANPTWNAFDVKVALSNTAKVLDTSKYDVFAQGAGRVQAYQAAHPEILAYSMDTANNDGETVENLKGTVTFGPQSLDQAISVNKQILVKNENGNGGTYNATVEVTKGFADATVTIDKPTFTLAGEQLLNVTLTASANTNAKPGDEMLGYIHITGGSTVASLPFAADFGGEAAAEVKDMSITETDLSFNDDGVKDEAMLYFTITGDVGLNFVEIWDIMNPTGGTYEDGYIGYLHAGSSLGAGSYQLPIRGQYNPWDGTGATTIPDGLYTIDFSGQTVSGNPPVIGDYVGPVVVKSTAGTVTGVIEGTTVTGAIDDTYIIYQQELVNYNLGYDINTKLHATYEVKNGEEVVASGPVTLAQDGTYTFELPNLDKAKHTVIVKYEDAAGNKAEAVIYNAGDQVDDQVTYTLNEQALALQTGDTAQLTLTETTTKPDGTTTDKDVTANATFTSADETVATVQNGTVTAVAAGTTEITVTYNDFTAAVTVEVTDQPTGEETVTYTVNKTQMVLGVGQQEQLYVTETTVKSDGTVSEKDVTGQLRYNVVNNTYATVHKGLVTAKQAGKTQVRILIPNRDPMYVYLEVKDLPQNTVTYSVNKTHLNIGVGQQEQLYVTETTVTPEGDVTEKDITGFASYKVIDNTVATVKKGLVTAVAPGQSQVRITIPDKETLYVYLTVEDVPQDVVTYTLNKKELTMEVGQQEQLRVTETTVTPEGETTERDATAQTRFNVVNNTFATVQKGLVTAHAPGKTQVRVTLPNGDITLVYLEVKQPAQETVTYAINKNELTLEVGQEDNITVLATTEHIDGSTTITDVSEQASYTVADPTIASATRGIVTGQQQGTTQITVKYADFTATVNVTVQAPAGPDTVTVTEESIAHYLNNKKANQIIIDITEFDDEKHIVIEQALLKKIEKSEKDVVLQIAGATFTFEDDAIEELRKQSKGDLTIAISQADGSAIKNAISDIFTLAFYKGTGDTKQALNKLAEEIEITLPIDTTKVSSKKVAVLDLSTNKKLKAKYKKGNLEFETEQPGSFVVIND
ncbi:S8 family serine peptidase [Sporosarcina sp. ITBMC105]